MVFNLYNQLPFGKFHKGNSLVKEWAEMLGRTPSAVALKLTNFARLDPALQARGISGMSHGAKGEEEVWKEFAADPENFAYESAVLVAQHKNESLVDSEDLDLPEGKDRDAKVRVRVNQAFFRKRVLSAYGFRCCVTGLRLPELLMASHIVPWAKDKKNRLNPRNGLCLNSLHDRAFDQGLMWLDSKLCVQFSDRLLDLKASDWGDAKWMVQFAGNRLIVPKGFSPSRKLIAKHRAVAMAG